MDEQDYLDEFGKILIENVRDWVLSNNTKLRAGEMKGKTSLKWYEKIKNLDEEQKEIILGFAAKTVDSTLHYFLWLFEQHENLKLMIKNEKTGEEINLAQISDGLCGELYTEEGWIERFSQYPPTIE